MTDASSTRSRLAAACSWPLKATLGLRTRWPSFTRTAAETRPSGHGPAASSKAVAPAFYLPSGHTSPLASLNKHGQKPGVPLLQLLGQDGFARIFPGPT